MSTPIPQTTATTDVPIRLIKSVAQKPLSNGIILSRRDAALKRLADMESELGRIQRLVNDIRADVLHLTVEQG